ncbi:MAG: ABC transporter permease [Defluviitaleaceae bacterium]|nr:ABC transporter permease [Defluviitaleaceae bacterium]MCL2264292.1 ABC transporter permease [Defluviitaleaceae bacterium]
MHSVRVFFRIVKFLFKAKIEYPAAYLGGIVSQWLANGITMLLIVLTVLNFGTLGGWLPMEVMFLHSVWLFTYAVGSSFAYNLSRLFRHMAVDGTMDEALTRPVPPFLYLVATTFNIGYVSHITLAVGALVFSMIQLGISWAAWQWLWFVVMIVCGGIITACMMLICEMPSLRTRSRSPVGVFFDSGRNFAQFPLVIYPRVLQIIFTTVLPFGFVGFYPSQVLLGKQDGLLPQVNMWLSPVVAVLIVGITALCWRILSRRYESAGT